METTEAVTSREGEQPSSRVLSIGGSIHTIVGALHTAITQYWDGGVDFVPREGSVFQRELVHLFPEVVQDVTRLAKSDRHIFESLASLDAGEINRFLADHGFSITIDPLTSDEVAFASVLDALVKWLRPGTPADITYSGDPLDPARRQRLVTCPGVCLKVSDGVRFFHNPLVMHVRIETRDGDIVYLTVPSNSPRNTLELIDMASVCLNLNEADVTYAYNEVHFPMIDLHYESSVDWLVGLGILASRGSAPGRYTVTVAKEEARLRVNLEGARAQAAFAGVATRDFSMPKPYVINRPFLFTMVRPGMRLPYFAAWCNTDCWKDPGSLE